jgi:diguanylate cyclase (GGDEF)-like protein/PAS domain S-box-containing protein
VTTTDDRQALAALLDRTADALVLVRLDGTAAWVSPAVHGHLGLHPEDLVDRPVLDFVHPDDQPRARDLLATLLEGHQPSGPLTIRARDGDHQWRSIEILANPMTAESPGAVLLSFRDVTERAQAEDALRASEEWFRALVQNSSDVMFVVDAEAKVSYVSPSVEGVFGFTPEQLIGEDGMTFVHPDDRDIVAAELASSFIDPSATATATCRGWCADGTVRWIETVVLNLTGNADVRGFVANVRDVTGRKEAEDRLAESEARFRAVVQTSKDLTGVIDSFGRVVWVSDGVTELLGYEPSELIGTEALQLVHPDDLEATATRFAGALEGSNGAPLAIRVRRKDGSWMLVEGVGTPLPDASGSIESIIINVRDLRWRVEAEQALHQNEERYRALVQHSFDAVVIVDPRGIINYASPALEALFGRKLEDVLGISGFTYLHPDDVPALERRIAEIQEVPESSMLEEFRIYDTDGEIRWVEVTAVNMIENPAVTGIVANIRDITDRKHAEATMRANEARFRAVIDSRYDVTAVIDDHARIKWVTPGVEPLLGYTPEELEGSDGFDLIHPDDSLEMARQFSLFLAHQGVSYPMTVRLRHSDDTWRQIDVVATDLFDNPDIEGLALTLRDVGDRVQAERESQRLTDIFGLTEDLVGIANAAGELIYLNAAARRFFDLPEDSDVTEVHLYDFFASMEVLPYSDSVQTVLEDGQRWRGELRLDHADGRVSQMDVQLMTHLDPDGQPEFYSGVVRDISERRAFEEQLHHAATHDPLTELPNRTLLLDRLTMSLGRARRSGGSVAVLFVDVDNFKVVNDSLGHSRGDELLTSLARRLEPLLRPGDTVARFGGDEFVILCEDLISRQNVLPITQRIEHAVSTPFWVGGQELSVGVSIGIAFSDDPEADPEALIRDADAAMYRAKAKGRGRFEIFDQKMRAAAVDRLDTENSLRRAIENNELELHYQPFVSLESGVIEAFEALLRWRHPTRGLLDPGKFLGVAEESGLIVPIGDWVLQEACSHIRQWTDSVQGFDHTAVAVNLSSRQFEHPDLTGSVERAIRATKIDPARLYLEITEQVVMDDVLANLRTLDRLKSLGVTLAVDDFGTGYSSLSHLRHFPVDVLKVDGSFVMGLGTDSDDLAIVEAIVRLAHTLGLRAVAEGVETIEQLEMVRQLGCDLAQGFHLSRPLIDADVPGVFAASITNN